jgi:hypothetical protein
MQKGFYVYCNETEERCYASVFLIQPHWRAFPKIFVALL